MAWETIANKTGLYLTFCCRQPPAFLWVLWTKNTTWDWLAVQKRVGELIESEYDIYVTAHSKL